MTLLGKHNRIVPLLAAVASAGACGGNVVVDTGSTGAGGGSSSGAFAFSCETRMVGGGHDCVEYPSLSPADLNHRAQISINT